jgi:hypothetical protein
VTRQDNPKPMGHRVPQGVARSRRPSQPTDYSRTGRSWSRLVAGQIHPSPVLPSEPRAISYGVPRCWVRSLPCRLQRWCSGWPGWPGTCSCRGSSGDFTMMAVTNESNRHALGALWDWSADRRPQVPSVRPPPD